MKDQTDIPSAASEAEVAQLLQPLDKGAVGAVFENRVDNAGVAAVIVQRQKAELRAKQENAKSRLEDVLLPALTAAKKALLDAYTKAFNALLPRALRMAEGVFNGMAVRAYSGIDIDLVVSGFSIGRNAVEGYVCVGVSDGASDIPFDVHAVVKLAWRGLAFTSNSPVYTFPDGSVDFEGAPGVGVSVDGDRDPYAVRFALARFAPPQYVVAARESVKTAQAEHDEVAGYIMAIRKVLNNTGELHEQALAELSEMSLKRTEGGEALLAAITDRVRTSFAPKAPAALRLGGTKN